MHGPGIFPVLVNVTLTLTCMTVSARRAIELLKRYFQGELTGLDDAEDDDEGPSARGRKGGDGEEDGEKRKKKKLKRSNDGEGDEAPDGSKLLSETLKPRTGMPPLLVNLAERKPERLHYLGMACWVNIGSHARVGWVALCYVGFGCGADKCQYFIPVVRLTHIVHKLVYALICRQKT